MNPKETVQALMQSIQKGNFDEARSYLSSDFHFSGPIPQPVSGEEWIEMSANLKAAFPDLDYQLRILSVNGDTVNLSAQLRGTHKGDLDLTSLHMGVIPPTGKTFIAAREQGKATVRNGKVISLANEPTEGAGMLAILDILGVHVPHAV